MRPLLIELITESSSTPEAWTVPVEMGQLATGIADK
jgi:hypothetical protein